MDREEFTRAVLEYENTLYRVAKSMLGSEADCADTAQNALLRAWERLHTLRDPAYFKTWLTRILINECRAVLRQRARYAPLATEIAEGEAAPESMPPACRELPGHSLERLRRAKTYEEISAAVSGSRYAKARYTLHLDEKTGLPSLADAVTGLESMFFDALAEYMRTGYRGPAREELGKAVAFRADMLNISYPMRLRRFDTPGDKAEKLLLPLRGAITTSVARRALDAGSDQEALEIIRKTPCGKWLPEEMEAAPEPMIRSAQNAYFRKVLHGKLNLAVVYAFLILKEYEGDMLTRVFVALRYGLGGRPEMTQREVAELLGISQSYLSRLEKRIISPLRGEIARLQ